MCALLTAVWQSQKVHSALASFKSVVTLMIYEFLPKQVEPDESVTNKQSGRYANNNILILMILNLKTHKNKTTQLRIVVSVLHTFSKLTWNVDAPLSQALSKNDGQFLLLLH